MNLTLRVFLMSWLLACAASAQNTALLSTFTWPRAFDDSLTYTVTVHSSSRVAGGTYTVTDLVGDVRNVVINNDGTIHNSVYYGGPTNIPDKYTIVFTFGESYDLDISTAGFWGDPGISSPYTDPIGHPPIHFDFKLTKPDNTIIGPVPESMSTSFTYNNVAYIIFSYCALNTNPQYNPINHQVAVDFYLDPSPDKSCPICSASYTCSNGCNGGKNYGMPAYSFDMGKAGLRVTDTPVSYSPPVGPSVGFTTTYNQRDVGQIPTLPVGNIGLNWTYAWLTYIVGDADTTATVQRFAPGGGMEDYTDFTPGGTYFDGTTYHQYGSFAPERQTQAVLIWDPANSRYVRNLPDGDSEIYSRVVTSEGTPYYFITQQSDSRGNFLSFSYDSLNRLTTVVDQIGQVTTLSYGSAADPMKITAVTDPFGRSVQFSYDDKGRLVKSVDPQGIKSVFGYDSTNFLNSFGTPYGTTGFSTDNDANHQAIQATNPLGQTERVELRLNSVSAIPDTEASVPSANGLLAANSGLSSYNTYYWDRKAYSASLDYTKAHIWHWLVGPHGLTNVASSEKKALESRVWNTYQGQSNPGYIPEDALNLAIVTARVLDNGGTQASYASYSTTTSVITQSIDPLGRTTNYTYAANGIDLTQVSQLDNGNQDVLSTMTYNGQHEPLTVTDASGQLTQLSYNAAGQMLTSEDAKRETTTMAYDGNGYLQSTTGPVPGAVTGYTYDSAGRVQTVTDSEGYVVTMSYDNLDRPVKTTYPDGTSDQTLYDDPAHPLDVARTVDRQGRTTHNQYDAIRELVQTTDPLGRTTKYGWCTCGGLASLTDANGNVTTWNLDLEGRPTAKVYADSSQITYTYEGTTSRLHNMTDANGNSATYSYNLDNTLAGTSYTPGSGVAATPNVSFSYDPVYNRVLTMTDGTGTTIYSYNPITGSVTTGAGRLAGVNVPIAGSTATVAYSYDELGRGTGRSIDGATTNANNFSTTFDTLGRVTNVTNALGAFTYAYVDQTSRLSSVTYPASTGLSTTYAYYGNTGDQRLQDITNAQGSTTLSKFDYAYNPVGTIATWQQQQDSNTPTSYALGYDAADQLTSAVQTNTSSNATVSSNAYNYDPAGNRLAETTATTTTAGTFNALNQLTHYSSVSGTQTVSGNTSAAVTTVTVNAVPATVSNQTNFTAQVPLNPGTNTVSVVAQPNTGNTTTQRYQVVTPGSAVTALSYDANGNTLTDENGNHYQWDALNRLISITYPSGASSSFAYDGLSRRIQIVEKNSSGATTGTKNYLWVAQETAEERDTSNNVTKRFFPQGEQQNGADYYYTFDHLGSVREVCNSSGTILTRYTYDPYGKTTTSYLSGSTDATKQFAGMYKHQTSGLNLTRAGDGNSTGRPYNPDIGFINRDPIGENGGINLYDYVDNDPINGIDPLGLKTCWKRVRLTTFTDKHGSYRPDNYDLQDDDVAVGNHGAGSNSPVDGQLAPGAKDQPAYPPRSKITVTPDRGRTFTGTVSDWGSYNIIHPNLSDTDSWIDVHHSGHSDYGWIGITVGDNCPCPNGSTEAPPVRPVR